MTLESYLDELADLTKPIRSGRLISLSQLSSDETTLLRLRWSSLPTERRQAVIERLSQLAEDSPELDFDAVFLTALDDSQETVRYLAVEGLWEHEDRDVIPELIRLLHGDRAPRVRAVAAMALGRFILRGEYGDLRPRDAVWVTDALRQTIQDVTEDSDVRGRALESIGACSQPWVRDLIEDAYASGNDRLMVSALHAMGRSADPYWLPNLIQELQSGDPEARYEAATALGELEDEAAVPDLIELLEDEDVEVQEAVITALGQIGGSEAQDALRRRLGAAVDREREVINAALEQAEFGRDPLGLHL